MSRAEVRKRLRIPAPYFVRRGWSPEVLDHFDVGLCAEAGKFFEGRSVAPIYDADWKRAVGSTARSPQERCSECRTYHVPGLCPQSEVERRRAVKWLNSPGFAKEQHLYNWWGARVAIEETGVAYLCEGPGDVWRLHEAGYANGLALFGTSLSDAQQVLLEMSGALKIIILTNSDEAGEMGAAAIAEKLGRLFRVTRLKPPTKDLGEMRPEEVRTFLGVS